MNTADVAVPIGSILVALNIVGTLVFAASGALAAARIRQTLVTFAFFALATGVGGGTVRDLLIGAPVFWIHDPLVALVCLGAALAVWITPSRLWSLRALDWLDAVGLAAFAVYGTAKAMSYGVHPLVAALMGVITGCVGGIIRDLLAGEPSILLRPEIYVTAAALSAGLYALLVSANVPTAIAGVLAALAGFVLRALAIARGLALPSYKAPADRD
ncbi:MAG TPA: trimeric intracellular cation channel family protein [Sphingobium sp.]|nr:trimeric intracellular cation channel family protein [Sphingobium sp.]